MIQVTNNESDISLDITEIKVIGPVLRFNLKRVEARMDGSIDNVCGNGTVQSRTYGTVLYEQSGIESKLYSESVTWRNGDDGTACYMSVVTSCTHGFQRHQTLNRTRQP